MAENCWKCLKMFLNDWKLLENTGNGGPYLLCEVYSCAPCREPDTKTLGAQQNLTERHCSLIYSQWSQLHTAELYWITLSCTVPHYTVLYHTVLYCKTLHYNVPNCKILYCLILYPTAVYKLYKKLGILGQQIFCTVVRAPPPPSQN